jgi:hypothetical protein
MAYETILRELSVNTIISKKEKKMLDYGFYNMEAK